MDWKRNLNSVFVFGLLFWFLIGTFQSYGQNPVWTDEDWERAKQGLQYEESNYQPPKEKEQKQLTPQQQGETETVVVEPNRSSPSWSFFDSMWAKMFGILLVVALLFLIIFLIMDRKKSDSRVKVKPLANALPEELEVLPEESDLDRLLRHYRDNAEWRMATRILFLALLRQLEEKEWIIWKKDKTNRDYLREVRTKGMFADFREMTLVYELVWYGETPLSSSQFQKVDQLFNQLKSKMNEVQ